MGTGYAGGVNQYDTPRWKKVVVVGEEKNACRHESEGDPVGDEMKVPGQTFTVSNGGSSEGEAVVDFRL